MAQPWIIFADTKFGGCVKVWSDESKLMPVPLVALIRGLGYAIDIFSITLITLIPTLYHTAGHKIFIAMHEFLSAEYLNLDVVEFFTKSDGSSTLSFALAISPLPLIYLRIFFKRIMKTATLGESIVGIASYATSPGIKGVLQESFFGLTQYLISAFAAVFACIGTFMLIGLSVKLAATLLPEVAQTSLPDTIAIPVSLALLGAFYISTIASAFAPHSRSDVASFFDDYFHLVVKRLR